MNPDKIRARMIGLVDPVGHKSYYPQLRSRLEDAEASKARLEEKSAALQNILADLEQAQESIRESEERFRRLAENAADIIFRLRLTSPIGFEYVSPAAEPITGYSPDELYRDIDLIERLTYPDDYSLVSAYQKGLLPSGTPVIMRWLHKSGALIWVEMRHAMIYDDAGRLIAIEGIARDITERKAADEALRRRTEEIALLYEAGRELASTLDLRRVYTTLYQMAARSMRCDGLLVSSFSREDQLIHMVFAIHDGHELDVSRFPPILLDAPGYGLQSETIRQGEPRVVDDFDPRNHSTRSLYRYTRTGLLDDPEDNQPSAYDIRSALVTPLKLDGEVVGVVQVFSCRPNAYAPEHLHFLEALVALASGAAHNARLYAQAQQEVAERRRAEEAYKRAVTETQSLNHRLGILYEIGLALAQILDLHEVFRVAYSHVRRVTDLTLFAVSRYNADRRTLRMQFAMVDGVETDNTVFPEFVISENSSLLGRGKAIALAQPVQVTGLAERARIGMRTGKVTAVGEGPLPDSAIYLPLISGSQVIGLMELQRYQSDAFSADQEALLGATANQISLAIERAELYQQMRESLEEKEVLLREVHHRVKNNLEVVISLAELQSHALSDTAALGNLRDFQARVRTIALVHENLYLSSNIASVRADMFLRRLVDSLLQAFGPAGLTVNLNSDDTALTVEQATPLGLIVTELTTNAIKHAFPGLLKPGAPAGAPQAFHEAQVSIDFRQADGRLVLAMGDNGVGLPPELDWRTARTLGLRLVNRLSSQLNAELVFENKPGTHFRLTIPLGEAIE